MLSEELHPQKQTLTLTTEERYELIAQTAMSIEECRERREDEQKQLWDMNDIEINFDRMIDSYE